MINGIGVVGWGVGGIEAEAGMLGQPVYFLTPDVVGVELKGKLTEGVTATDLVLTVTEMLRKEKVVGKFVEFFGEGTASLSVPDRATIAQHGAGVRRDDGLLPGRRGDRSTTCASTGRTDGGDRRVRVAISRRRACSACPRPATIDYTKTLSLDLRARSAPSLAGPKRPQDRIELRTIARRRSPSSSASRSARTGFAKPPDKLDQRYRDADGRRQRRGAISDASACSRRNGHAARRRRDGQQPAHARPRTTSRDGEAGRHRQRRRADRRDHVVHEYVEPERAARRGSAREEGRRASGLTREAAHQDVARARLARGHRLPDQGRIAALPRAARLRPSPRTAARRASATPATCAPEINDAIVDATTSICAAVLSGNRNFEARIHPNLKANFLASPPLVVAYAIAGTVLHDLTTEPLGDGKDGKPVFLQRHLADVARDRAP